MTATDFRCRHAGLLFLDHSDDLRLGEAAFPHIVCSFAVKQTLHQSEGHSGGQVNLNKLPDMGRMNG